MGDNKGPRESGKAGEQKMDWQENRGRLNTLYMAAFHIPSNKTSIPKLFIDVLETHLLPSLYRSFTTVNWDCGQKNKILLSSLFEKVEPL